jgi:hypothetical protein
MQTGSFDQQIPRAAADRFVLREGYVLLMRIGLLRAEAPDGGSHSYEALEQRVRALVAETEAEAF